MKIAFLGVTLLLLAAAGDTDAQQYLFHTYDETDGLPSTYVYGVVQDTAGTVWLATRKGVVAYDGADWKLETLPGTVLPAVSGIRLDGRGRLWAVGANLPLHVARREDGAWHALPPCPDTGDGRFAAGLALVDDPRGETAVLARTRRTSFHVYLGGTWHTLDFPPGHRVVHTGPGPASTFLLATNAGLLRVDCSGREPVLTTVPGLPPGPVYGTLPDTTLRATTVLGEGWRGRLDGGGFVLLERDPAIRLEDAAGGVAVARDAYGCLFLGGDFEVLVRHPRRGWERLDMSGFAAPGATDICADREGLVWLTSPRGVRKLVSRRFASYDSRHGLLENEVSAVQPLPDGGVLLGHQRGLTFLSDDGEPRFIRTDVRDRRSRVMDIEPAPGGAHWLAAERAGLARLEPDGSLTWHGRPPGRAGAVFALHLDDAGRLWVGTVAGLFLKEGDRFTPRELRDGDEIYRCTVRRLQPAAEGGIWVATSRLGVVRVAGAEQTWYRAPGATPLNETYGVLERPDGTVWVGTAGGLCRAEGGELRPVAEPAVTDMVFALLADRDGGVWFGTGRGLRYWRDGVLRSWTMRDGLAGNETNRDALVQDAAGRIWIGTDRGVSVHDDHFAETPRVRLPVALEGFTVDGRRFAAGDRLELSAGARELVIRFGARAYRDEERLRFRTRLEPDEEAWSPARTYPTRSIRYTNLPPGRHRFHLQAIDVEGNTSPVLVSGEIAVQPPLWQRWWFVVLAVVGGLGLLTLLLIAAASRRFARRLSGEVAERTAELRESEARFRTETTRLAMVLDSISDGVLLVGADGRVLRANPGAARILGVPIARLRKEPIDALLPELNAPESATDLTRTLSVERPGPPGGPPRVLEVRVAPYSEPGGPAGARVLVFDDVTDRRQLAAEQRRAQRLESLGVLAGGIAHDFNNLLTIVMGNASIAAEAANADVEIRRRLGNIGGAAERARGLTSQLLTFARGGAPDKRLTDLAPLVREVSRLALSGTNVNADLDLPSDLPHAEVDAGQIEQVLSNLLINAAQAMPGGGSVGVRAFVPGDGTERQLVIEVSDSGPGVPREMRERVFEPYFSTKDGGSGLGLAVAHSVVRRHGGRLGVDDAPGGGARFTVELPASRERADAVPVLPFRDRSRGGRILVLDDEAGVREVVEGILLRHGFSCETVADGEAAVARFAAARHRGEPFDAVLLDLTVPGGMGGAETIVRLQEIDPDVRGVVISGYESGEVLSNPRAHGFRTAVRKPFAPDQILDAVDRALC